MRHAGTADGLYQCFFNDAVFDIQGQLAGALLRRAPADTVREAGTMTELIAKPTT